MLVRQEKIAIILLFLVSAALTVSFLILDDVGRAPFATSFSTGSPEGALVVYNGVVDRIDTTRSGGHLVLDVSGVQVFIPGDVAREVVITPGDQVRLYGVVQTFRGEKEIIVEYCEDITIGKNRE